MTDGINELNAAIQAENAPIATIATALAGLATVAAKIDADIVALLAKEISPDMTTQVQAIQSQTSTLATSAQQISDALAALAASDTKANG